MFTAEDLKRLHEQLDALRDHIGTSEEMHETSAQGCLADADWDTIHRAASVVHRLYRWRQWPAASPESYLPEINPQPIVGIPEPRA